MGKLGELDEIEKIVAKKEEPKKMTTKMEIWRGNSAETTTLNGNGTRQTESRRDDDDDDFRESGRKSSRGDRGSRGGRDDSDDRGDSDRGNR